MFPSLHRCFAVVSITTLFVLLGTFAILQWIGLLHQSHGQAEMLPIVKHDIGRTDRSVSDQQPEPIDVNSNHPAAFENLWLEMDQKNTLIRRTAYFDNRMSTGPVIVIIALQNKQKQMQRLFTKLVMPDGNIVCQEIENWLEAPPSTQKSHWNHFRHGPDNYRCNILRISLKKLNYIEPPAYIEISENKMCNTLLPPMPVFHEKREKRVKFALCLQKGIFGYVSPELLVQFVEINKVLGASIITIWIQNTTENVYTTLVPYIKSGLVELLDWKVSVAMRNYGQHAVNNECYYRNIHRAEYLILQDIDELMIPQKHESWYEMFDYITNNLKTNLSQYASFRVQSVMWRADKNPIEVPKEYNCSGLNIPYYFISTSKSKQIDKGRPKSFLSLDKCTSVITHRALSHVPGVKKDFTIRTKVCLCHHYRFPPFTRWSYRHSSTMERFVGKVMPGIAKHLCT